MSIKAYGWVVLSVSLLSGCYPVKQYQSNIVGQFTTPAPGGGLAEIPLGFVEFDDNGEIFSRTQLENTEQKISDLLKACPDSFEAVVFIHGWKNNASSESNNVPGFEAFLRYIHKRIAPASRCSTPLMGVYIGWRGARVRIGKELSYWNGTDAAVRAGGPHLEETLFRLIRAATPPANPATAAGDHPQPASRLIVIGHSFGGRVLEKVMTPFLETQILSGEPSGSYHVCGPGGEQTHTISAPLPQLMVLLNEAAPATDAKQFLGFLKCHAVQSSVELMNPDGTSHVIDYPLFLSITSDGDWANHVALPLGQFAAKSKMKTRPYCGGPSGRKTNCSGDPADPSVISDQSTYYTHTTASIPALYSHYVVQGTTCNAGDPPPDFSWTSGSKDYSYCRICCAWNRTPYWVSSIPVSIVPDHSDIFRDELFDMLFSFIHVPNSQGNRSLPPQPRPGLNPASPPQRLNPKTTAK